MDRLIRSACNFDILYNNIDGYGISALSRLRDEAKGLDAIYGEVLFYPWKKMVDRAAPKKDGVFFDLGSGTGKAVLASHMAFDFRKSIGVEFMPELHQAALAVKERFEKELKPKMEKEIGARELLFINDNIFNVDLREADFIFLNYPLKKPEDFTRLENKFLDELRQGTKIITTIRSLRNPAFKSLGDGKYKFGWGAAHAYFYEV